MGRTILTVPLKEWETAGARTIYRGSCGLLANLVESVTDMSSRHVGFLFSDSISRFSSWKASAVARLAVTCADAIAYLTPSADSSDSRQYIS